MHQTRLLWMDILNITACICVVLLHCNHQIDIYHGSLDFPYIWGVFVYSFAFWPVPVFMMLSCCNLLNSQYDKKLSSRNVFTVQEYLLLHGVSYIL